MKWLRRIRGALLMGLTWAIAWAPIGLLIGLIVDSDGRMDEPWIAVGTFPGFLSGVAFSIVLGIAARNRRFSELSLSRFTAWGAGAGLFWGLFPYVAGEWGSSIPVWLPLMVTGSITALGGASAAGTLMLARRAEKRERVGAGPQDSLLVRDDHSAS